ncbi:MAG: glycosyl hydrolase family 15 [Acaryochloridaceae cyanobacterium RU_4_10]|nr:glycosyl hydrolase family 15 [Acaryochloridaceae cyanobacterium RU_4_10]
MDRLQRLDNYYQQIKHIILARQSAITGLLPASTAVNAHGDYTDAWVRDNVYSILAAWGLALAYRKFDDDRGRAYELEHSVIKLMRGLLTAMMKQSAKVERFKETQLPLDAMHAKYDTHTGDVVVADDEWGHLQLDATSLYLLVLAQTISSGLAIIQTLDEVNFVQNLVYYIGRTYRTPDFGIWERGNKINHGNPELNVSSIGMAKAALEAMNGLNLFGIRGGPSSVVHVLHDEIARSRTTLISLLPRESNSKEVDAALLSVIGFPAFAVEDEAIVERTRQKILDKLAGNYGCKRFLRDGHQTVLEDTTRLHYEPEELQQFEHIECEWPLFFTYLVLDGLFRGDLAQVETFRQKLQPLFVERHGWPLLPELYYVPKDKIAAERFSPNSQVRRPNENIPLIWAQSLYLLGELIAEGFIALGDVDPLGRHLRLGNAPTPTVQIALVAEDESLQQDLKTFGVETQTLQQLQPIQVLDAKALARAYHQLGQNSQLGLSGRPIRRLRSLTTACLYRFKGEVKAFLPSFLDRAQFYLTLDYHFLVDQIKSELAYIRRHWSHLGRPTVTLLLTKTMLAGGRKPLLQLFQELNHGECNGVKVKLGPLRQLILMAGIERIDTLGDFEFIPSDQMDPHRVSIHLPLDPANCKPLASILEIDLERETNIHRLLHQLKQSTNLYEQIELLQTLLHLKGLAFDTGFGGHYQRVTVQQLLDEIYDKAGELRLWSIIRRVAGLTKKVDISLSDAITHILVRQRQVSVGKAYSSASVMSRPMSHLEIMEKIAEFCREDVRDRALTQEIILYFDLLLKAEPHLFEGLLTLRVGYFILLITSELASEFHLTQDEAYERLMSLSPFEVKERLRQALVSYETLNQELLQQESLHLRRSQQSIEWIVQPDSNAAEEQPGSWQRKRELQGMINRLPAQFYPRVWGLLKHCKGLIIGDKLNRLNRLNSKSILSEMTPEEKNFALQIEHLLQKIGAPQYRQLNIEALMELSAIVEANPEFYLENNIVMDVLIGHAVRLAYLERFPERSDCYDEHKSQAWSDFYDSSPLRCAQYTAAALRYLTELGTEIEIEEVSIRF